MIFPLSLQRQRPTQRQQSQEQPEKSGKIRRPKVHFIQRNPLGRYKFRKCEELLPEWNGLARNVLKILLKNQI